MIVDCHGHYTVLPKEQVWVDPDCGLKTRTVDEAIAKLQACVTAARLVRWLPRATASLIN